MSITMKAARVNRNLNQAEAAKLLGISRKTLQNYEAGASFPNIPILKRIESVYKISYSDIVFWPNSNDLSVKKRKDDNDERNYQD